MFAGYVTDPALGGPRVSREGIVCDGWLNTGDLGSVDADGFVYLTGRAKDLIIRGGHNIDPQVIEEALLRHPAVRHAAAVGRPDRHSGEVPVAYVVPAGPGRFDEAELLGWAAAAIGEPAARPKHIYPVDAIPVTAVGKQFKPALAADAAARAVTEALAGAGLDDARATAAHEDGRLVVTVTGADPGQVRDALAGFALMVRSTPSQPPRPPRKDPQKGDTTVNDRQPAAHEPVIVVGAGPVGCTAALLLADFGIRVTLLERHTQPHPLPRAVHLDDEVARTLDRIGVSEQFLARSRPGSGLRLLDARHRVMAEFRRNQGPGAHGFPQANMFHQPDLEESLLARVMEHPRISFYRGAVVFGMDGTLSPLTAAPVRVHARFAGEPQSFTGQVALGCDGAGSTIRELAGITMDDLGFTERWLVIDIQAETSLDTWDGVEQVCDPARAATFMQVTGDRYRWEFQLRDGEDEAGLITPASWAGCCGPGPDATT